MEVYGRVQVPGALTLAKNAKLIIGQELLVSAFLPQCCSSTNAEEFSRLITWREELFDAQMRHLLLPLMLCMFSN